MLIVSIGIRWFSIHGLAWGQNEMLAVVGSVKEKTPKELQLKK